MSYYVLGAIANLPVLPGGYAGLDYKNVVMRVRLIGDTSGDANEALQTPPLPRREGSLHVILTDPTMTATIRGYYAASTRVAYSDPTGLATYVVVGDLAVTTKYVTPYEATATLTLIEVP